MYLAVLLDVEHVPPFALYVNVYAFDGLVIAFDDVVIAFV